MKKGTEYEKINAWEEVVRKAEERGEEEKGREGDRMTKRRRD